MINRLTALFYTWYFRGWMKMVLPAHCPCPSPCSTICSSEYRHCLWGECPSWDSLCWGTWPLPVGLEQDQVPGLLHRMEKNWKNGIIYLFWSWLVLLLAPFACFFFDNSINALANIVSKTVTPIKHFEIDLSRESDISSQLSIWQWHVSTDTSGRKQTNTRQLKLQDWRDLICLAERREWKWDSMLLNFCLLARVMNHYIQL